MFTGREWFPERGIYDYRNRFYQPELGRFLQTDPKGFDAGDINLFRYCGDDPVDHTDPTGEIIESGWDAANVVIGAATLAADLHEGNNTAAIIDGAGLAYDVVATAIPFLPGGASTGIKVYRGSKLARNLAEAGRGVVKGSEEAHHIIAANAAAAAAARSRLAKFGIDIDHAINGMGLPKDLHRKCIPRSTTNTLMSVHRTGGRNKKPRKD